MDIVVVLVMFVLVYFVCSKIKFRTVHSFHEDMDETILTVKEWYPFGLRTHINQYTHTGEIWYNNVGGQLSGGVSRALTKLERTARRGE